MCLDSVIKDKSMAGKVFVAISTLLVVTSVQAQTMSASMCKVLTNKSERQKCLMRYGAETVKKQNSDTARERQSVKTRKEQFSAQSEALKPFDEPKITDRVGTLVYFTIKNINRGQYVNCRVYSVQGRAVAHERFRVSPKEASLQMKIPVGEYANKVTCK